MKYKKLEDSTAKVMNGIESIEKRYELEDIHNIANLCGYTDSNYFCRIFKKNMKYLLHNIETGCCNHE